MSTDPGAFDEAFLSQVRLGIVAVLLARRDVTFTDLKALLGATQGNLGVHLQKLEEVGYVAVARSLVGKKPRSSYALTKEGKHAFAAHVRRLERLALPHPPPPTI